VSSNKTPLMSKGKFNFLRYTMTVGIILAVCFVSQVIIPDRTKITLTDGASCRKLLSAILTDGDKAKLTWHNSLFDLDVEEDFVAEHGVLVQTSVTFTDPRGLPPMVISPEEVNDYYHTGGPFTATGMHRPFTHIVYRIGEIGNPRFSLAGKFLELKKEVGFGGRVVLDTGQVILWDMLK
jgi:hypothetical protein